MGPLIDLVGLPLNKIERKRRGPQGEGGLPDELPLINGRPESAEVLRCSLLHRLQFNYLQSIGNDGERGRNRTFNLVIKSQRMGVF